MTPNIIDFTNSLTRLRSARMPPTTGLAPNEIVDDTVTIGKDTVGWDKEERNGRVYMTRKDHG